MKTLAAIVLVLASISLQAQDEKPGEFNISVGYMFEGTMYIGVTDRYYSVGETILLRAEYDYYFGMFNNHFGIGGYYTLGFPWYSSNYEEVNMMEFGLVLKARIPAGDNWRIKPGVYAGYRLYGGGIDYLSSAPGDGLGVNGSVSLQYNGASKFKPFLDIGFLTQPSGGNEATDITFDVTLQVCVGITL